MSREIQESSRSGVLDAAPAVPYRAGFHDGGANTVGKPMSHSTQRLVPFCSALRLSVSRRDAVWLGLGTHEGGAMSFRKGFSWMLSLTFLVIGNRARAEDVTAILRRQTQELVDAVTSGD